MNKSMLLMTLIAIFPVQSFASDWDISQLANQLEYASQDLSRSSKGMRGYSSVSHNAKRLSDKAEKLADSIARGRTSAYIRTRYSDLSRYYQRLETAFLRANRNYGSQFVGSDFELVANLYDGLSYEFYGDHYYQNNRLDGPYYSFGQSYRYNPPYYSNPRVFVFPQVGRGYAGERRDRDRDGQRGRNQYDHRSPVIDRQNRNDRSNNNRPNNRNNNDARSNDSRANDRRANDAINPERNGRLRNENRINNVRDRRARQLEERRAPNRVTGGAGAGRSPGERNSNAAVGNRATTENRSNRVTRERGTETNRGNRNDASVRRGRPD